MLTCRSTIASQLVRRHTTAIVAGLALAWLAGCDKTSTLVTVNSQKEANEILVALSNAGGIQSGRIVQQARSRNVVWDVEVAPVDESAARELLLWLDLPRERSQASDGGSSLIPTKAEERLRLIGATAAGLERSIEMNERVVRARAVIVLPDHDVLRTDSPRKPSATVTVKYVTEQPTASREGEENQTATLTVPQPPLTEQEVRDMVAKGVEGLEPQDVAVKFTAAKAFPRLITRTSASPLAYAPKLDHTTLILLITVIGLGVLSLTLLVLLVRRRSGSSAEEAGATRAAAA